MCGRCYFCLNAFPYYYCEQLADYGNSLTCRHPPHLFGGWAESMVLLPGTKIFRVPDELPDEVAVLTEVMSVTHGLETARALSGTPFAESVAVVGVGPLGLCHLIKARLLGCGKRHSVRDNPANMLEIVGRILRCRRIEGDHLELRSAIDREYRIFERDGADNWMAQALGAVPLVGLYVVLAPHRRELGAREA